jgi:alkylation response protein AidB-like acyl-CoA dehydrogenase
VSLTSLTAVPPPSVEELVSRAKKTGTLGRHIAERTEANRQVSAEAIAHMRDAGFFRIMQPAMYGGYEYGFDALVRIVAAVAVPRVGFSAWELFISG